MSEGTKRRDFLKYTAATGMGFWVLGRQTLAQEAQSKSPNEKVNFASVGVLGKGDGDSAHVGELGNLIAVCDAGEVATDYKGKLFPKARKFSDFRKMFDEMGKEIDAITVSVPDHNHAVIAMMGVKNKKHVYVQKPMTHYVAEARALRKAAQENKVATSLGNQGTATNGLRVGVEAIQDGIIGNVHEVHVWTNRPIWPQAPGILDRPMGQDDPKDVRSDPETGRRRGAGAASAPKGLNWEAWLGPAPYRPFVQKYKSPSGQTFDNVYQPFNWRGWWDWGTGALGDMACHTANLPYMALKLNTVYPTRISAESGVLNAETYPSWATVKFEFPARGDMPPVTLYWHEGRKEVDGKRVQNVPSKELLEFQNIAQSGSCMVGDKGIMYSPDDYGNRWMLLPVAKFKDYQQPKYPSRLPKCEGNNDLFMKKEWIAAMRGGPRNLADWSYSGMLTEFVLLGNVAIRAGKQHPLEYDGENMKITNWPEANNYLMREYRPGYSL
jgi:predicted dehydrogenase